MGLKWLLVEHSSSRAEGDVDLATTGAAQGSSDDLALHQTVLERHIRVGRQQDTWEPAGK
jgi:hypothetical protein